MRNNGPAVPEVCVAKAKLKSWPLMEYQNQSKSMSQPFKFEYPWASRALVKSMYMYAPGGIFQYVIPATEETTLVPEVVQSL